MSSWVSHFEILKRVLAQCDEVRKAKDDYYNAPNRTLKADALKEWKVRQLELDNLVSNIKQLVK